MGNKIEHKDITEIDQIKRDVLKVADTAKSNYLRTKDLKNATIAIRGYSTALKAVIVKIEYKRATGE